MNQVDGLRQIFHRALELSGSARESYLAEACAGNPVQRKKIEGLIAAHENAGSFLIDPTEGGRRQSSVGLRPGDWVNGYRIIEEVGHGGFGIVFRAEQREPIRRLVALKVVKPGMDTRQVIARFEVERQALALMDHPNIARVYDAGATAAGLPYFVMEFVEGEPITEYCDRVGLTLEKRLELFIAVCQGVHHAHQKGIIHRDLKPSNLLVGESEDQPVPKVIDFGVAKATGPSLTDITLVTKMTEFVGTPSYTAPEQISLSVLGVDTRADIYSLGVLLYQLLTGTTPIESKTMNGRSLDEIRTLITQTDPPLPSARVAAVMRDAHYEKTHRLSGSQLRSKLRNDLEWVVMKALEKDRSRRYSTVADFSRDLERFLTMQAVEAGPPGGWYRIQKFMRRHRTAVGVASVAAAAVVAVIGALVWSGMRSDEMRRVAERDANAATREARRSDKVVRLLKGLLDMADPHLSGQADVTLRDALLRQGGELSQQLAEEPEIEMELRETMGRACRGMGQYQRAESYLQRALQLAESVHGVNSLEAGRMHGQLGWLWHQTKQDAKAAAAFERALQIQQAAPGPDHPDKIEIHAGLAEIYRDLGRMREAGSAAEQALAVAKAHSRENDAWALHALATAGEVSLWFGAADGIKKVQAAHDQAVKTLGAEHSTTISLSRRLGEIRAKQGQFADAEKRLTSLVSLARATLGKEHPETLDQLLQLGKILVRNGHSDEIEKRIEELFHITAKSYAEGGRISFGSAEELAYLLSKEGRFSDYEPLATEAATSAEELLGPDHEGTLGALRALAFIKREIGKLDEAIALHKTVVARHEAKFGPRHPRVAECLFYMADDLVRAGRESAADALFFSDTAPGAASLDRAALLVNVADQYAEGARPLEARSLRERALVLRQRDLGDHEDTLASLMQCAEGRHSVGYFSSASLAKSAEEMAARLYGGNHPATFKARHIRLRTERMFNSLPGSIEARKLLEQQASAALMPDDPLLKTISAELGTQQADLAKRERAVVAARKAAEQAAAEFGVEDQRTLEAQHLLARTLMFAHRFDEARQLSATLKGKFQALVGPADELTLRYPVLDGYIALCESHPDDAVRILGDGVRGFEAVHAPMSYRYRIILTDYANVLTGTQSSDAKWAMLDGFEDRQKGCVWELAKMRCLVPRGARWLALAAGDNPAENWRARDAFDANWSVVRLPAREAFLSEGSGILCRASKGNENQAVCFRRSFDVAELANVSQIKIRLRRSAGAAVFLNGREIVRDNLPAGTAINAQAPKQPNNAFERDYPFVFTLPAEALQAGRNVLAAEVHRTAAKDSLVFDLQMEALLK